MPIGMRDNGYDIDEVIQERQDARVDRQAEAAPTVDTAVEGAPTTPEPAADTGGRNQSSGRDRLQRVAAATTPPAGPGSAPRAPARVGVPNTPGGGASFAGIGSQGAAPFRSTNFFQNRMVGGGGDRLNSSSAFGRLLSDGSSSGGLGGGDSFTTQSMGAFGDESGVGGRRRGKNSDLLKRVIMGGSYSG